MSRSSRPEKAKFEVRASARGGRQCCPSVTRFPLKALAAVSAAEYNSFNLIKFARERTLACPFFMPTEKWEAGAWMHPARLPLGAGWRGHCCAPGHEGAAPSDHELSENCNLGYAAGCPRLPQDRSCDAVRFAVVRDAGARLVLNFSCELDHRPAGHGVLEYDEVRRQWTSSHPDARMQKMAECFLQSYLLRRIQPAAAGATASANP